MKTHYISTIVLIAGFVLCGCSHNEETAIVPDQDDSTKDNPAAVIAHIEGPATRTTLDFSRNVVWTSGDQIRIFGASAVSGEIYGTTSDNTRTGIFLPSYEDKTVDDETRYAVYPATAASSSTLSGSVLEIDMGAQASQPYIQTLGAGSDISLLPMICVSTTKKFTFKNICGGIQLQLNDYQVLGVKIKSVLVTAKGNEQISGKISVDASTGVASVAKSGTLNTVAVDCGQGADISSGGNLSKPTGIIIFLPAGEYADGFSFVITDTEGRCYEIETKQAVTVLAGVITPLQSLPLTLYYGTANCYMTTGAGTLEIDATPYYTFAENYVHEGLKCLDAENNMIGLATKAKIVWQQVSTKESGDVVSSTTLDGTTLKVSTTGKSGNAVVAICNNAEQILWSYHVWVSQTNDITYVNSGRGTFQILDRNLGATSTALKDCNTYGLFYQWGRKDPFARNLTAVRPAAAAQYYNDPSPLQLSVETTAETGTIAYANRNPQTRVLSTGDWYFGTGGNNLLWGYVNEGNGVKSVYDPCPAGYRIPEAEYYSELTTANAGDCNTQYGYLFMTGEGTTQSYFPTGGYLVQATNQMRYLEYRGYLWLNQPTVGSTSASRFGYNNASIGSNTDLRAAALPIRCVKI